MRSGRAAPRRLPCAEHVGSRSIGESDSEAREFAHRALRLTLEVLDHRRPIAHLDAMADLSVVSTVRTLVRGGFVPGHVLGTAVLTRVDVVMVNSDAAELCAAYDRGHRHFALAAHIARTRADRWHMTALRVL
ncbi:Rv3235 family protein [Nocardia sp. CA-128927]|uniref:Rv3235 family protein n=1 Tax=Nocardia sp. CA-128927 TaxID=3239975 RepID=UPI003D980BAC